MNKRIQINKKIGDLQKQLKELELQEQIKVGTLVLGLYRDNKLNNEDLHKKIAVIVGDISKETDVKEVM
jgi:hypothetical protein